MARAPKKASLSMAQKRDRVRRGVLALGRALDNYEDAHPHWRIEVLVSLLKWSIKSLKHYLEDSGDGEITWDHPFVELRYPVDWDWAESRARGEEYGRLLFGNISDTNISDKETAVKTLSEIMARLLNAHALGDLTNWVRFEKNGEHHKPFLTLEFAEQLNSIKAKGRRQEVFKRIVRPFSIGAALVDYGTDDLKEGSRVSKKVARQLAKLSDSIDIPRIRLSGDVNGREIDMSLVFQIHPLITDHQEESAYHPITVGLFMEPLVSGNEVSFESPAEWPRQDRETIWKELVRAIDLLAEKLIPKGESEDSLVLTINATLKVPASRWNPESRGDAMKIITDALSLGGELSEIHVGVEGHKNELKANSCNVCGFTHDPAFTQILVLDREAVTLAGVLPDIVKCVHAAHEKGFPRLSTKDDSLLRRCGSYRNPCKAFYDLHQSAAYKVLFDTSRRGFIALRGFRRKES